MELQAMPLKQQNDHSDSLWGKFQREHSSGSKFVYLKCMCK